MQLVDCGGVPFVSPSSSVNDTKFVYQWYQKVNGKLPFTGHFNSVGRDFQSIWKRLGFIKGHLFGEKRYEEILRFELLGLRIPVQLVFEFCLGALATTQE